MCTADVLNVEICSCMYTNGTLCHHAGEKGAISPRFFVEEWVIRANNNFCEYINVQQPFKGAKIVLSGL